MVAAIDRRPSPLPAPWRGVWCGPEEAAAEVSRRTRRAMLDLPDETTWRARREAIVAEIRAEIAIATDCIAQGRGFPGKAVLRGPVLVNYKRGLEGAIGYWERELERGPVPDDAPVSDELPPGYWHDR